MTTTKTLRLGVVGSVGRGRSFKNGCEAVTGVAIQAVCDIQADKLESSRELLGAAESFADYEAMLESGRVDAVIVATPMPLHVEQSVAALERGIHVLSEVPAAVSVEECRTLVRAAKASSAVYMMAENYTYRRPNVIVREMVRQGLFGTPYYGEGEYLHELIELLEKTPWRRRWAYGIDGVTYGTHSLGPLLQWMPGDRVTAVCGTGAGRFGVDAEGESFEQSDTTLMLCKMKSGGVVKIRQDLISPRPHAMTNYQLQGTDGAYESARAPGEPHRIWLRAEADDPHGPMHWKHLDEVADKYLPDWYREREAEAKAAGHGGGDFFEILDFVSAIHGESPCPIGIHEAMDMTLPGLLSQQSIQEESRWIEVPDSRDW